MLPRMKILSVVGARPQFIKAAMVSPELRQVHQEVLVHTGQHYDFQMSQVFFNELDIPEPDHNLGVGSGTHAAQTARMMLALEPVILKEKPDVVLVYGDTNSTLAAALTAAKMNIPVAHVEAGPRTGDMTVPEEMNRVVTDRLSTLLLAPTQTSVDNLAREGISAGVHFTGDVMLDAFLKCAPTARERSTVLHRLGLQTGQYVYATVHRARNTDQPGRLGAIVQALSMLDGRVVLPLHPRTRQRLQSFGLWDMVADASNILPSEPVGYLDSLMLTLNASNVVTDSGGLQREAYFAGVPCVTLDNVTPWPETVTTGWNILAGSEAKPLLTLFQTAQRGVGRPDAFGDGKSALALVRALTQIRAPGECAESHLKNHARLFRPLEIGE